MIIPSHPRGACRPPPLFEAVYPNPTDRVPDLQSLVSIAETDGGSGWMPCFLGGGDLFLANCSPLDADTSIDSRFMLLVRGERQPGRSSLSSTSPTHVRSSTAGTVLYPVVGGNPMMSTLWASSPMAEHAKIRRGGNQHPSAAPRVQSTKSQILQYAAPPP